MILDPLPSPANTNLRLANGEDEMVYELPDDSDWVVVQLDSTTAWTASSVVTVQFSLTPAKFHAHPDSAVTFSALGLKKAVATGLKFMRLYVSTPQAGSDVVTPTVNAGRNN